MKPVVIIERGGLVSRDFGFIGHLMIIIRYSGRILLGNGKGRIWQPLDMSWTNHFMYARASIMANEILEEGLDLKEFIIILERRV